MNYRMPGYEAFAFSRIYKTQNFDVFREAGRAGDPKILYLPPGAISMMHVDHNTVISLIGFVMTLTVTVLNRRSSSKDREAKALEAKLQAEVRAVEVHAQLEIRAAEIKAQFEIARMQTQMAAEIALKAAVHETTQHIIEAAETVHRELAKNTDVSVRALEEATHAYTEANNVNVKIAELQSALLVTQETLLKPQVSQANEIRATGEDTNQRVRAINKEKE